MMLILINFIFIHIFKFIYIIGLLLKKIIYFKNIRLTILLIISKLCL